MQFGGWRGVGVLLGALAGIGSLPQEAQAHPTVWSTSGPAGAYITAVAIDPQRHGTLYAAAWGAGIFKSTNGGVNWRSASTGLSNRNVATLAIDPHTPTTLYTGTATGDAGASGAGVFKSMDGGETWRASNTGLEHSGALWRNITCLAIDPRNPQILYAGGTPWYGLLAKVFKSIDGGETWNVAGSVFSALFVMDLAIDPQTPTTIYAVTWAGKFSPAAVVKSIDGGATWNSARDGLPYSPSHASYAPYLSLAIDAEKPSTLYLGTADDGVFKSTDGGGTWKAVNSGLPPHPLEYGYPSIAAVETDPSHPNIVYAGLAPFGLFRSINRGESWSAVNYGSIVQRIAVDPSNNGALYIAGPQGIFKSIDDGRRWTESNVGLGSSAHVVALAMDPAHPGTVYAGTEFPNGAQDLDRGDGRWRPVGQIGPGIFKSADRGEAWSRAGLAGHKIYSLGIDPRTPATIYAGTWGGRLFKSTDEGAHWIQLDWIYWDVLTIAIDPTTSFVYVGTSGAGIYKSTDGGGSWNEVSVGLGPGGYTNSLFVDPGNPLTLYAGTFYGGVFKSTDGGSHWNPSNSGLTFREDQYEYTQYISTLAIDPSTPTTLYAGAFHNGGGATGGVFRSDDGGEHWSAVSTGLDTTSSRMVYALAIDPRNPAILYAGTEEGVFTSSDRGAHWGPLNTGLTGFAVKALVIDPRPPGVIYAGSRFGGVFVLSPASPWHDDVKPSKGELPPGLLMKSQLW
jgi:photosystem II stability/assembly factor-like uncharacterized protein